MFAFSHEINSEVGMIAYAKEKKLVVVKVEDNT